MPALCGELNRYDAQNVLNISVKDQEEIVKVLPSLTKQHREVLPNPGCLDKILNDDKKQNLVLIPSAKKRSKNVDNQDVETDCNKKTVPLIDLEKQPSSSPKRDIIGATA